MDGIQNLTIGKELMRTFHRTMVEDYTFHAEMGVDSKMLFINKNALIELEEDGYVEIYKWQLNNPMSQYLTGECEILRNITIEGKITDKGLNFIKESEIEK